MSYDPACVQVAREGTKKTVFTNFMELCKAMNRQLEHVQLFLLAELGTSGNLDGQSRLIVKGRFLPKAFEGVLRRYVNECALPGMLSPCCFCAGAASSAGPAFGPRHSRPCCVVVSASARTEAAPPVPAFA